MSVKDPWFEVGIMGGHAKIMADIPPALMAELLDDKTTSIDQVAIVAIRKGRRRVYVLGVDPTDGGLECSREQMLHLARAITASLLEAASEADALAALDAASKKVH